jgi:hypothetical protein
MDEDFLEEELLEEEINQQLNPKPVVEDLNSDGKDEELQDFMRGYELEEEEDSNEDHFSDEAWEEVDV